MARILIACEFSGIVRDAFLALGHDAWSCDLVSSERPGPHIQGDVLTVLSAGWDVMLAFPPCTHLSNSGARWWHRKQAEQQAALAFVRALLAAPIPRICLENPEGKIGSAIRTHDQLIHPWEYGEEEEKKTCLWLKNLPYLQPTKLMAKREQKIWRMGESKHRQQDRSRTYPGIAHAFATQWGTLLS
jgi:hypothetical protein